MSLSLGVALLPVPERLELVRSVHMTQDQPIRSQRQTNVLSIAIVKLKRAPRTWRGHTG